MTVDELTDKLLYPCFVCKQENCSRTRPLEKTKAQQYGLNEDNIPTGARVCNNCQCKAVKSRFSNTNCPLPTCPNPKDRVKRFRNLPARLFELAPEERDPIIKELQIPPNVTKCCSACLTRIKRKMGAHLLGTTSLSDDEIQQLRNKLQDIGPKWSQLADQLNKSATVLKTFYYNYKKKYGFDQAVNEYYKMHANEDRRAITDGDESDVSVTSSDDNGSDTHKNELNDCEKMDTNAVLIVKSEPLIISSTPTSIASMSSNKDIVTKNEPQPPTTTANTAQVQVIDDRLPPPLGQPPPLLSSQQIQNLSTSGMSRGPESHPLISIMRTKKHSEEYDSSATETADEENESSPANRQSPKAVFAGKGLNPATTISMVPTVPPQQQNGPLSNVRDVLHNVIERTLKNPGGAVPPLKHNPVDTNPDVSFVSAYRQDPNKIQIQPQRRSNSDSGIQTLATLSIVNSHGQQQNIPGQNQLHPLNISSIAATITPVPPPPQANQQLPPRSTPQHMIQQDKDMKYHTVARAIQPQVQHNEPEPQTLDLSIKKPQQQQQQPPERNFPAFQAKAPPPPTAGSIYRGDPAANIPNQSNYLAFHPDQRPSKSPSNYIPPPLSPGQRVMGIPPPHSMQQPQQIISNKSKVTPKLSPNVHHQMQQQQTSAQVQQMNGPKGSITKGTPINDRGQPITIQNARYEILRHTPPSAENKFGSIIAGTPVNINDKRVHEYMKNNRHSPATNQQNPTSAAQSGSPHPTITYRPPGDLSSTTRDLVFSDYMISQQMHNQQVRGGANMPNTISIISGGPSGRPEKESPSPRSIAHSSSPASLYYADKDRDRVASGQTRPEYLSRSSPADHHNSNPSPHRTPPPQRQGVIIQRHNNASSKPPSPAPLRQGHFSHHYSQGHDALSNLVDVAVAQQALPVPNDNSRRPSHMPPTSSAENLSSLPPPRDRGYPYLIPAEVMALQHQQIDLMRRQQQHEYNERKERELIQERERDRERNRERDERETQRRIDADLAERNFERDRMEQQLRISYQPRLPYTGRLPDEISAQCLINAIITENISRPADARERYPSHPLNRLQPSENNGNSHSPNVINVDVDSSSDLSRHSSISSLPSKNLKLNDITDAIIAKDPAYMHHQQGPPTSAYHLPAHLMRTSFSGSIPSKTPPTQSIAQQQQSSIPQPMGQEQIVATEQWKINRKLQQQQQQKEELAKSGVNMQGRSTPDERHVIRMAQSPSPRTKMAYEPVSPPETSSHYHIQPKITINAYDQRNMPIVQENAQGADENKLLKLINNRLAEVMRNDDKYPNEHHSDGKDRRDGVLYERPRSGNSVPGNGINSGDKSPAKRESPQVYGNLSRPSSQPGNMPFQPSPSMSFLYPYSALTIPQAAGANPIISPKAANEIIDANRQQQPPAPHLETRQVLSENYDALSDED
ncbi:hypothetical protein PVAND_002162 [Polypedilum vanderplanki]|uniref:Myb-like domain-containing protein n=1 Tax=Polypedilum vanderplanki TaxID=319348 RepID=A0A9J6BRK9_POLVA|nr:hypothetical protein PVAND_002162 [Polypedilum vanderplanki]